MSHLTFTGCFDSPTLNLMLLVSKLGRPLEAGGAFLLPLRTGLLTVGILKEFMAAGLETTFLATTFLATTFLATTFLATTFLATTSFLAKGFEAKGLFTTGFLATTLVPVVALGALFLMALVAIIAGENAFAESARAERMKKADLIIM